MPDLTKSIEAKDACLIHAEDLIESARTILGKGKPNIAYHLATLALEEIGKVGLIHISLTIQDFGRDPTWAKKNSQDHVKKLFFAFFGAAFGNTVLKKEEFESFQSLADKIHGTRLRGLYVDFEEELSIPSSVVSEEECKNLIELTSARLEMEKAHEIADIPEEEQEVLKWFIQSTDDPEIKKMLLGQKSMEKLAELGSAREWLLWLKEVMDNNAQENRELAEQELKRQPPEGEDIFDEKWKVRIRIYCASHSLRQKVLNTWNDSSDWIKLIAVKGAKHKQELILEFTLTKSTPIEGLWWQSWGMARQFVTALNIGSLGYFWWNLPKLTDKFYEKIIDLESNAEIRVVRSPSLEFDWGNRALTDNEIANAAMIFALMPRPGDKNVETFNHYVGGLTFLGINDINWQCEINAFDNFWKCFKSAARIYGGYSEGDSILQHMNNVFREMSFEEEDLSKYCELGKMLEISKLKKTDIDLENAAFMKALCDAQFLIYFRKMSAEKLDKKT